jgi:hypothetical protein
MKFLSMRSALALAASALALTACGGGKATFTIAGYVDGLKYDGMVLTSNGMDIAVKPPAKAGETVTWQFPKELEYGDEYAVSLKTAPAHQECSIPPQYASDTAGRFAQINVPVLCKVAAHSIGGNITGLTKDGLVLVNGSTGGSYSASKDATKFVFANPVTYGVTYGVTVLTSPAGLSCTVQNGAGTMDDKDVADIAVTCVPQA